MEEVCHWFKSKRPHLLLVFSPCFALVVHAVSPSFCSNHHTFHQLPPSHPLESEAQTNPFFYKSWSECLFAATENAVIQYPSPKSFSRVYKSNVMLSLVSNPSAFLPSASARVLSHVCFQNWASDSGPCVCQGRALLLQL